MTDNLIDRTKRRIAYPKVLAAPRRHQRIASPMPPIRR